MNNLESKFQFLITLALFLPVIMEAVFDQKNANPTILQWGIVIAMLIVNYLYISSFKHEFPKKMLKFITITTDFNILSYALFILTTAYQVNHLYLITNIVLLISFYAVMFLPLLILVSLPLHFFWRKGWFSFK